MAKIHLAFLCLGLTACATSTPSTRSDWSRPTFSGTLPLAAEPEGSTFDQDGAPETTTLPVGVGITTGPGSLMLGAALDFPIDKMITVGPSIQAGFDNNVNIIFMTAQLKYYLPVNKDSKKESLLPYLTAGAGLASVDKDNRSGDEGAVVNIGAGLRILTGEHYRIGSEARLNWLADEIGGEDFIMSFELLQVVISF